MPSKFMPTLIHFPALALALSMSANPASAQSVQSAEEVLALIKHALVDAALDESINVVSSAYIDTQGRLVESAYYDTHETIRGVRILEYLQEEHQPDPQAAKLPDNLLHIKSGVCEVKASRSYSPAIQIRGQIDLGNGRLNDSMSHSLSTHINQLLKTTAQDHDWLLIADDERIARLSPYERLLTGLEDSNSAEFELRWSLSEVSTTRLLAHPATWVTQKINQAKRQSYELIAKNPFLYKTPPAKSPDTLLKLDLELMDLRDKRSIGQAEHVVPYSEKTVELIASNQDIEKLLASLGADLDSFIRKTTEVNQCRFNQFSLGESEQDSTELKIMLGEENNVKVGERFLLFETPWQGANEALNSELVGSLSIGEITRTEKYHAYLKVIAGNGSWKNLKHAVAF